MWRLLKLIFRYLSQLLFLCLTTRVCVCKIDFTSVKIDMIKKKFWVNIRIFIWFCKLFRIFTIKGFLYINGFEPVTIFLVYLIWYLWFHQYDKISIRGLWSFYGSNLRDIPVFYWFCFPYESFRKFKINQPRFN